MSRFKGLAITEQKNKYYDKDNCMEKLQQEITAFIERRNWAQFHTPKNLAMALSVETSELVEIFQWMTAEESCKIEGKKLEHVEEEIGDVMIYLLTLATSLGLDPLTAAHKKIQKNALKYPISKEHEE